MIQAEPRLHALMIDGAFTERGFWLYVWRGRKAGRDYHYIGRTGGNSGTTALSPIQRFARHITSRPGEGVFSRRQLLSSGEHETLDLSKFDRFDLFSFGPVFPEADQDRAPEERSQLHRERRDLIGPLERQLCKAMRRWCEKDGHRNRVVINTVPGHKPFDEALWRDVHKAFAEHFEGLPYEV